MSSSKISIILGMLLALSCVAVWAQGTPIGPGGGVTGGGGGGVSSVGDVGVLTGGAITPEVDPGILALLGTIATGAILAAKRKLKRKK